MLKGDESQITLTFEPSKIIEMVKRVVDMDPNFNGSTNSFDLAVKISKNDEILLVPSFPNVIVWNLDQVKALQELLAVPLWPEITLLPVDNLQLVDLGGSFNQGRAIALPFQRGYPRRLHFVNLQTVIQKYKPYGKIPLSEGVRLKLDQLSSILIVSPTRTGKSYFLVYLLEFFCGFYGTNSVIAVIDPKVSEPAWYAHRRKIKAVTPVDAANYNDFLSEVISTLSETVRLIQQRQDQISKDPDLQHRFVHKFIIIDEALSLGISGTNKKTIDQIGNLMSIVALQGAQSRVHLVSCWQNARITSLMNQEIRQSANATFALSRNNSVNSLMFPNSSIDSLIIPRDSISQGTGICKVVGNFQDRIFPFLSPSYT